MGLKPKGQVTAGRYVNVDPSEREGNRETEKSRTREEAK